MNLKAVLNRIGTIGSQPGAVRGARTGAPDRPSFFVRLRQDLTRLDRSQISFAMAARNTVALALPLAFGAAIGHPLAGLTISIGALNVAFSDTNEPYPLRGARMLAAAICGALSVFVGCVAGKSEWLLVTMATLWGLGGGLTVIGGPQSAQIGMVSVILLVVFAAHPADPSHALTTALLFIAGGLFQLVLAVAAWPLIGAKPERQIVGDALRQIAAYARRPRTDQDELPASMELIQANSMLTGITSNFSPDVEKLRSVLNQTERIRLEIVALKRIARDVSLQDVVCFERGNNLMAAAAGMLDLLANMLENAKSATGLDASLNGFEAAAAAFGKEHEEKLAPGDPALLTAHAEALGGEMRTVARLERLGKRRVAASASPTATSLLSITGGLSTTLRANLSLRSAALRHALRLAVCIVLAEAVQTAFPMPHAYWIAMTAAIVLKPDYAGTVSRGLARLLGTFAGLVVATGVVLFLPHTAAVYVVLIALFALIMRSVGRANYLLSVIPLTALIVVLLAFAGEPPEPTIVARGIATVAGGVLALAIYAAWPTWESLQTPLALADLIDAECQYFDVVADCYLEPRARVAATVSDRRLAARRARVNAEASVERLYAEPKGSQADLTLAVKLLASLRRFATAVMELEAGIYDRRSGRRQPPALMPFAQQVDAAMHHLAAALRRRPADPAPTFELRTLRLAPARRNQPDSSPGPNCGQTAETCAAGATLIRSQTEQIANALDTMMHLLGSQQA